MIFNMVSTAGSGGGSGCTLTVTAPAGVTVHVGKDGVIQTKTADETGTAVFQGLESGTWTVTITDGAQQAETEVTVNAEYTAALAFQAAPEFSYTGTYELKQEGGGNWKARLLTSGTLRFTKLNGVKAIDVFLVGGGGGVESGRSGYGGAGGGYTTTARNHAVAEGTDYAVVIGAGGDEDDGGATSGFGYSAAGGLAPVDCLGGDGGSGGGAGWYGTATGSNGGSDGQNAPDGSRYEGGIGQGTTTREFGEPDGELYAGGGAGCSSDSGAVLLGGAGGGGNTCQNGAANTGGGAGAARKGTATLGGSGIVVIRNAR